MTAVQVQNDSSDRMIDGDALPAGTILLNGQYTIERYLSSGGFGITYLARDSLDRRMVIKECYPEAFCSRTNKTVMARSRSHLGEFRSLVSMFVREAHSLAKLRHPNIVGVHQVFEDNETAYMALDLIDGQDLLCVIEEGSQHLTSDAIQLLLVKLLDAIANVHAQDMLHRDISPDNILLDGWGNPVLIDFGAAREEASKKSRAISTVLVVKDGYSPQEFYISGGQQGPWSDLYALAATFYHLISGAAPPNSQSRLAAIAANRVDLYDPLVDHVFGYPHVFLQAIDKAMNVFPVDRIQSARDWLALIDDDARRESAFEKAQLDEGVRDLVSKIVVKVENDIAHDKKTTTSAAQPVGTTLETRPVEKVWEDLSAPEPEELMPSHEEILAPQPIKKWSFQYQDPQEAASTQLRIRTAGRRLGLALVICSVTFNLIENPTSNVATAAAPAVRAVIEIGSDLRDQLD